MRRVGLPLLALLLIAVAIAATRACSDAPVQTEGPATTVPLVEERIDRKRVEAASRTDAGDAEDAASATDDAPPTDEPSEPLVQLQTLDEELALSRRFVSGIVVGADGEPVRGVDVELTSRWLPAEVARHAELPRSFLSGPTDYEWPPLLPQMTASMSTGSDGRFRLPYVVGDHLRIAVSGQIHRAPVTHPHEEQRILLIRAIWEVDVQVVRAADGTAVSGAAVTLTQPAGYQAEASTGADGRALLDVWSSGRATLDVIAEGLASLVDLPVDLAPAELREIEVRLAPEYRVRGRVVDDETGRPIAGAHVAPGVPRHWSEPPDEETDADGRFEIRGMPVVERTSRAVGAIAEGYVPVARWLPPELPAEGYRETELRMVRGGSIRLRCVDASGAPVSDALVFAQLDSTRNRGTDRYAQLMDINEGAAWTESDGVAVVDDLPFGDRPVEVRIYLRGVEVVRSECPSPAAGETVDVGDVVVVAGGSVTGTVLTADGRPAAGVAVVVVPDDPADEHLYALADAALGPDDERHGVTDAAGRFEILGLAPGTWHALAWTERSEHAPRLIRGVVVPADGDAPPVTIRLPHPAVLQGVLLDDDGAPMAGMEVGALRDAPVPINLMEIVVTDEQGKFRLPGVTAVGQRVWVSVEIEKRGLSGVLVTAGPDPLELRMDRLGPFDPDVYDRAMGR